MLCVLQTLAWTTVSRMDYGPLRREHCGIPHGSIMDCPQARYSLVSHGSPRSLTCAMWPRPREILTSLVPCRNCAAASKHWRYKVPSHLCAAVRLKTRVKEAPKNRKSGMTCPCTTSRSTSDETATREFQPLATAQCIGFIYRLHIRSIDEAHRRSPRQLHSPITFSWAATRAGQPRDLS